MKIGYGNYGMPQIPVWDALPRLAEMGYEAVEICAADRWPTAPRKLSADDRKRLRDLLAETGLELSAFLVFFNMLASREELEPQERILRDTCALARDLAPGTRPVVVSTLGHTTMTWEEALPRVLEGVGHFTGIAAAEGCRLALEPHAGNILDCPARVTEVMERLHSPSLGINFDISHFAAGGYDRTESIRAVAPYAFHTHVKDGRTIDGRVVFDLPGETGYDYAAYFREMAAAGYPGVITVEVSVQISDRPDYDPWAAARYSLDVLEMARAAAASVRG
jgi:sugar phosphate isomerase/epimerase